MIEEAKAVKEIIKANATALYQDAAQPSIRVVGKSLAQCVSLFATPVGRMAEIFEKNLHRYLDKLDGLKEEELVAPDTRVLVPILEKMRFTDEEKVAEYYAEILATATRKEHAGKVMLTFIEILNRLTADEIKILEFINSPVNKVLIPELTEEELREFDLPKGTIELNIKGSLPVIDINSVTEGKKGYRTLLKNFSCLREIVSLDYPANLGSYVDNMISLGLLEKKFGLTFAIEKIYHHLENHKSIQAIKTTLKPEQKLNFDHGRIDTTDLGKKLLDLCSQRK